MILTEIIVLAADSIPENYNKTVISGETLYKIVIILGIVVLAYMILSTMFRRGKFNGFFKLGSEKKLEECQRKGFIVTGTVVGIETEQNNDLRVERFDKLHKNCKNYDIDDYITHKVSRKLNSIDDGKVSYRPKIKYAFDGKTYSESYYRYIDERKFRLKDGDSVRIVCAERNPHFYIIHGDTESYRYLNYILGK